MQNVVFNAFPRGLKLTRPTKHSGDAWLTFSDSNKPYVPVAWRSHKSRRSEMRLFREFLAKSVFRAKYQRCIFPTFFLTFAQFFLLVLHFTSISRRYIDIVKDNHSFFLIPDYWHSAIWRLWIAGYYCAQQRCLTTGRWDLFLWSPHWRIPETWPPVYSSVAAWS